MNGIAVFPDFVTEDEERDLVAALKFSNGCIPHSVSFAAGHDADVEHLCARLVARGIVDETPDDIMVRVYKTGEGLDSHTDHPEAYGDTVCSLSLGADGMIEFTNIETRASAFK